MGRGWRSRSEVAAAAPVGGCVGGRVEYEIEVDCASGFGGFVDRREDGDESLPGRVAEAPEGTFTFTVSSESKSWEIGEDVAKVMETKVEERSNKIMVHFRC